MGYLKDFVGWFTRKPILNRKEEGLFLRPKEIWWCSLGVNVGYEQDGTGSNFDRPVLVIKVFNRDIFLGVALTGSKKSGKYYHYIGQVDGRHSSVIISQIRTLDSRRLTRRIGIIEDRSYIDVVDRIVSTLFK